MSITTFLLFIAALVVGTILIGLIDRLIKHVRLALRRSEQKRTLRKITAQLK